MEFKGIEKKDGGKFLHRYDLRYIDPLGAERCYEMVSRRDDIEGFDQLVNHPADAVVMIVTDRENEREDVKAGIISPEVFRERWYGESRKDDRDEKRIS